MSITLTGGPADGRTIGASTYACNTICVPYFEGNTLWTARYDAAGAWIENTNPVPNFFSKQTAELLAYIARAELDA